MGYYNVIYNYGVKNFVNSCKSNGVDGLIVVDLQPEEDPDLLIEIPSEIDFCQKGNLLWAQLLKNNFL